jgi:hypothetical protein
MPASADVADGHLREDQILHIEEWKPLRNLIEDGSGTASHSSSGGLSKKALNSAGVNDSLPFRWIRSLLTTLSPRYLNAIMYFIDR